ncbi:hypothetical protein QJS10_CPB19g01294 [Acorus calamus]|uniref:Nuclear pore complex protein NUP1 n=1 Tax=Acorus calamus TaxID=4465 RepID=A0AAV9CDC8_ACOCL|nr:hypothetical protein QJS10_CPB19g01294 [Acorus calamus]
MASAANPYEGGAGGKFRRHPLRKSAATPYDRPPETARGGGGRRPLAVPLGGGGGGGGWLSKLVDPASRIITGGATRLFSSVFRKRLPAPPPPPPPPPPSTEAEEATVAEDAPEVNLGSGNGVSEVVHMESLPKRIEQESVTVVEHSNNSDGSGISELEQLLNQKTFTRVESDRLMELLRSRTIDLSADKEKKMTQPSTSQQAVTDRHEIAYVSPSENGIQNHGLLGRTSTGPFSKSVHEEEMTSPTEIAKTYMGTTPSKLSSSASMLQSPAHREHVTLLNNATPRPKSDLSLAPRSAVRFSGVPGLSRSGNKAPVPCRSAIYNMSRSPYSRFHPASAIKSPGLSVDGYANPSTSSLWSPVDVTPSTGKQALKRRSSVLDEDGFNSVRSTRQKSYLSSPFKDRRLVSGNLSPGTSIRAGSFQNHGYTSTVQKPGTKYDDSLNNQVEKSGDVKIPSASFGTVPPRSSEMAMKIFQHLNKLVPSPKDKSSQVKVIGKDKSPQKLPINMLNGGALRSMENLGTSDLSDAQVGGTVEGPSTSQLPSLGGSIFQKHDQVEENGPTWGHTLGSKLASEVMGMKKKNNNVKDNVLETNASDSVAPASAAYPLTKTRLFQMNAPEGSLEGDDNNDRSKGISIPSSAAEEKLELSSVEHRDVLRKSVITEEPVFSFTETKPSTTPSMIKGTDKEFSVDFVLSKQKNISFTNPVVHANSSLSLPASMTPTLLSDGFVPPTEQTVPNVSFVSKEAPAFTFSSKTTSFSGSAGLKFGTGLDSKQDISGSDATLWSKPTPEPPTETSIQDKGGENQKAKEPNKSPVDGNSSGSSIMPTVFSFGGASTSSSLSNGSLTSISGIMSVTTAPAVPSNHHSISPFSFSSSAASTAASEAMANSAPSTNTVSLTPTFAAAPKVSEPVTKFQFGSSTSASAVSSVSDAPSSAAVDGSNSELNAKKSSPFGINGPSVPATTPAFASTAGGIFSFGASTSSSLSSLPSANMKSQSSSSPFEAAASVSLFGTESSQSGTGASIFAQSTTSQFGATASSPIFTSRGSSSPFGVSSGSLFGSSSSVTSTGAASSISGNNSSFAATTASSTSFGSASPSTMFSFGLSPTPSSSTPLFGSSTGFSFTSAATTSSSSGLSLTSATNASSSPAPSSSTPLFGSSTGFSFTSTTTASSSLGFSFTSSTNASSSSGFSFPSSTIGSASSQPTVGMPTSPGNNDQMSVEDSMVDDAALQPSNAMHITPSFGQMPPPNATFGSPAIPTGVVPGFQFGNMQNSSPFTPPGGTELSGGNFSLGSGGAVDKSGRRIVKVNRNKYRKK